MSSVATHYPPSYWQQKPIGQQLQQKIFEQPLLGMPDPYSSTCQAFPTSPTGTGYYT